MVSNKKIINDKSEIWIDGDGILVLFIKDDADLDLEEVTQAFKTYSELGIGPDNKCLQLIDARGNAQMSSEASKYASEHGVNYFIASAVITRSLTIRLIVNFFNVFYKHAVPLKIFDNETSAREWLLSFKK